MSTKSADTGFTLLDVLIDEDPKSAIEPRMTDSEHSSALREAVEADISSLLNNRHWLGTWPPELELLRYSILNYGLPDLSAAVIDSKSVQSVVVQTVRTSLEVYEPRLSNIKVGLSPGFMERAAQMFITADIRSAAEPLGFRRSLQRSAP